MSPCLCRPTGLSRREEDYQFKDTFRVKIQELVKVKVDHCAGMLKTKNIMLYSV